MAETDTNKVGIAEGEKTLPGGINDTRQSRKEFAIKHTLLICWQPVAT